MEFAKIHKLVKRFVRGGDTENLAAEIQLEALERGFEVSLLMIRRRCYDYLRRLRLEQNYIQRWRPTSQDEAYDPEYVHLLLESADLTPEEKQIIFAVFWQEKKLNQIAHELSISINRASALLDTAKEKLLFAHYRRPHDTAGSD